HANYDGNKPYNNNAKGESRGKTWAVGSGTPNPWGLYDMAGNVSEWCWDWSGPYDGNGQTDPTGVVSSSSRIVRGGNWYEGAFLLRSARRGARSPSSYASNFGFRVVRP
ncbi:MAG: SUMF1/EgtB/PvdO family nonheme iron enzyme, partial [Treponema sp.]|nr:SUMF1/EgtB/PvdO family nonheme iron enzyme [Treponema sp.]